MKRIIWGTGVSLLAAGIATTALALPVTDAGKVVLTVANPEETAQATRRGPKGGGRDKIDTGRAAGAGADIKHAQIKGAELKHSENGGNSADSKVTGTDGTAVDAKITGADGKGIDFKGAQQKLTGSEGKAIDFKGAHIKVTSGTAVAPNDHIK